MARNTVRTGGDRGSILVMTALALVMLLGIAALSIDASFMYDKRNRLYAAADAAAKSVAVELLRQSQTGGITQTAMNAFADQQVAAHQFTPARSGGTTSVVVRKCSDVGATCSVALTPAANYVEVVVSESTSTFFGKFLGRNSFLPGARAVAGWSIGTDCVVALGQPPYTGTTRLTFNGGSVNATGCNIAVNGDMSSSASPLTAASVNVTGRYNGSSSCSGIVHCGVPPTSDPLAYLAAPSLPPGPCTNLNVASGTWNLLPGCYSQFKVRGSSTTVNLNPDASSVYYFTGAVTPYAIDLDQGVRINANGVMLYIQNGRISIGENDNPVFTLNAPTSGQYQGISLFQARGNQAAADFTSDATYNLSGAFYLPDAPITFSNDGTITLSGGCFPLIAKTISISNLTMTFSSTCIGYGGSPLRTVSTAE